MKIRVNIVQEIYDQLYKDIIRLISKQSDCFSLIDISCLHSNGLKPSEFIKEMEPHCTKIEYSMKSWPGTAYGVPSDIYYYESSEEAIETLLKRTSSLFESYNAQNTLEDIAFYSEGKDLFYTTSHEKVCQIEFEDQELLDELLKLEYIKPYALIWKSE